MPAQKKPEPEPKYYTQNIQLRSQYRRSPYRRSQYRRSPYRRSPYRRSPYRRSPYRSPYRRSPLRRSPLLLGGFAFTDGSVGGPVARDFQTPRRPRIGRFSTTPEGSHLPTDRDWSIVEVNIPLDDPNRIEKLQIQQTVNNMGSDRINEIFEDFKLLNVDDPYYLDSTGMVRQYNTITLQGRQLTLRDARKKLINLIFAPLDLNIHPDYQHFFDLE
jgi:hypothetical protein